MCLNGIFNYAFHGSLLENEKWLKIEIDFYAMKRKTLFDSWLSRNQFQTPFLELLGNLAI
jgi:hypothetical protein